MAVDAKDIKAGVRVKLADGAAGEVRGSYMSAEGIVLRVATEAGSVVQRNVPLADVVEILERR